MSLLCFHPKRPKIYKRRNAVIMTSNCKFMSVFELSGSNCVFIPNFSLISLEMADFSLFGTFCNFVAMVIAQNVTN